MSSIHLTGLTGIFIPIVAIYFIKASHDVIVKWLDTRDKMLNAPACNCTNWDHCERLTVRNKAKKVIDDPVKDSVSDKNTAANALTPKPFNVNFVDNYVAK